MANYPPFGNAALIGNIYQALLQRNADDAGFQYWLVQLGNGIPVEALANSIIGTPEYIGKHGSKTNAQFVDMVYQSVLLRAPDAAGGAFFTAMLADGSITRGRVVSEIVHQPEAYTVFAQRFVGGYITT